MKTKKYVLDTNAVVEIMRNPEGRVPQNMLAKSNVKDCSISELTLYELYAGAYASKQKERNVIAVERITDWLEILPVKEACREAAKQKNILKSKGELIEDVDILIGSTAISTDRILVTNNIKHMSRLEGISIENWEQ